MAYEHEGNMINEFCVINEDDIEMLSDREADLIRGVIALQHRQDITVVLEKVLRVMER